jgi:hypothetical protein
MLCVFTRRFKWHSGQERRVLTEMEASIQDKQMVYSRLDAPRTYCAGICPVLFYGGREAW